MKRFHLHVSVGNLDESIQFYSMLFAEQPTVRQSDYAKWMLADPRMNFAISTHRQPIGVNHLGFQVDSDDELRGMQSQLLAADSQMIQEKEQACCYAKADKYWVTDPTGIAWETFHTLGSIPVYGEDTPVFGHGVSVVPIPRAVGSNATGSESQPRSPGLTGRTDCCGGPASGDTDACCFADAVARSDGISGCGCETAA
jgi:hypothetical protein